jgi:hypothetical protein
LEIAVPERIAPAETAQLTATFVNADGSREDAGARVRWSTDAPLALTVSQTGLIKGEQPGGGLVMAEYQSLSARVPILVLPSGTFKLSGVVTSSGLGVSGVTVTVDSGGAEGTTTTTHTDGRYALYGVTGLVRVRLTKSGYEAGTEAIEVTDHRTLDVALRPDRSTTNGTWTLTLSAGPCESGEGTLPPAARIRTYTAVIVETDGPASSFSGILSDAPFFFDGAGNRIWGSRNAQDRVWIVFQPDYYFIPVAAYGILERLTSDSALAIVGQLQTELRRDVIDGQFAGYFRLILDPPDGLVDASCYSRSHRLTMRRK